MSVRSIGCMSSIDGPTLDEPLRANASNSRHCSRSGAGGYFNRKPASKRFSSAFLSERVFLAMHHPGIALRCGDAHNSMRAAAPFGGDYGRYGRAIDE
jgi:hypothetical protein